MKSRIVALSLPAMFVLAGCGLAETAATSGASGAGAAAQAKEGQKVQEKVRDDVEAMQRQAAEARAAADAAATGD